jgi:hypothetical protein
MLGPRWRGPSPRKPEVEWLNSPSVRLGIPEVIVAGTLGAADFAAGERRSFKGLFETEGWRLVRLLEHVLLRLDGGFIVPVGTHNHLTESHSVDSYCKAACVNFRAHPVVTSPSQGAFVDALVKKVK